MSTESIALAVEWHQQGRIDDAERIYRNILAADPENPDALHLLGMAAQDRGQYEDAVALMGRAISLNPWASFYHSNLGNTLQELRRFSDAVLCYEESLRLGPECPQAHNNLGNALRELGRLDEAILHFLEAVRRRPDYHQAYRNLGNTLTDKGLFAEAAACYREAVRLRPDWAEAHKSLGNALLITGEFREGWEEVEWRWLTADAPKISFTEPVWDGSRLDGRTILLWAEQGLGDTLQFVRYAGAVAARGGRVVVECQTPLVPLVETVAGVGQVVAYGDELPRFEVHAPLQSLPRILGTTAGDIPATVPYLRVSEGLREKWAAHLSAEAGLKVGLAWAGNPANRRDHKRSIRAELLAPLERVPGVRWFSLQKNPPDGMPPLPITDVAGDFPNTAAAIECLDLVISVDSAMAHLTGALGKPVWTLLPFVPDWRWLLEREDTPWYPSMRLFRQSRAGDWQEVLERIAAAIAGLIHRRDAEGAEK